MSAELIAIMAVGAAIAGLVVASQRNDFVQLRERVARLEGLLEGLREAIGTRPAA